MSSRQRPVRASGWTRGLLLAAGLVLLQGADCSDSTDRAECDNEVSQAVASLRVTPGTLTVAQGAAGAPVSVSLERRFTPCIGDVTLLVTDLPTGVTAAVTSPGRDSTGSFVLSASAQAVPGRSTVTLVMSFATSKAGTVTHRQPFELTVTAPPAIALAAAASAQSLVQGTTGTPVGVTVTRQGGFAGAVTVAVDGLPAGITAAVTSPGTGTSGTVTFTVGAQVAPARYPLTLRASAAGVTTQSAPFELTVTAPPSFTASIDPTGVTVLRGASGTATLSVTRGGGFTGAIATSVTGVPTGVTITGGTIGSGSSAVVTFQVAASAPVGVSVLEFSLSAPGLPTRTVPFALLIADPPGITLSAAASAQSLVQGTTGTPVGVTVTRQGGFAGAVTVAVDGLPAGITAAVTSPGTGTSGTVTFTVGAQVAPARYPLTLRASAAGVTTQSVPFELTVTPAAGPGLILNGPSSVSTTRGGSSDITIGIFRSGWTGSVALTVTGAPSGMTATMVPASTTANFAVLRLDIGNVAIGSYPLVVRATGANGVVATVTVTVQVSP